jgi:hypothetical protein
MNVGGSLAEFGATSQSFNPADERNGAGQACGFTTAPPFSATRGYREVNLKQQTDRSLVMQRQDYFIGRPVVAQ